MAATTERRWRVMGTAGGALFFLLYLYAIGDLDIDRRATWQLMMADASPDHWMQARAPFLFEAMALLEAGWLVWLISPVNLLIAGLLGGMMALNIHGIFSLRTIPQSCGIGGRYAGAGGAVPALLAGSACCAPSLLLLLGIPGLGAFSAFFPWLVPLSVILLALSRWWQRHMGATAFWPKHSKAG